MKKIDYTKYPLPRIRHHANPVLYFPLKQHKSSRIYYPDVVQKIDWRELFANSRAPEYLDIGCGLGKFLIETSLLTPGKNFLGLEVRSGAVKWIQNVAKGESLGNVQALWFSAVNGFPFLEDSSIKKVFYFFPDPWVKKRHYKRRAFSVELLNEIHRVLKPEGKLYLMTDVPEVDLYQQKILAEHGGFQYTENAKWELKARTNQEEFCLRKEIPFVRMICSKVMK